MVQVYTHFGYDGVGACRRIKDELAGILERDGATWEGLVSKAIRETSLRPDQVQAVTNKGEDGVQQLIQEAENLRQLLDGLSDKL
jgi:dihydroorotate dehydrogenase